MLPPLINLAPDRFELWHPPAGAVVHVGPDRQPFPLPDIALPLPKGLEFAVGPPDDAIGQALYDYLRQFPDCPGNAVYAGLLRDAWPHYISDLAAYAVMLDAKQVEPAYVLRKLGCLKILHLLEPSNRGLLEQLSRGFFELALDFGELANCRSHLREAMRYGQELLALSVEDVQALSLLAEIDFLLGDYPAAGDKWRRLAAQRDDPALLAAVEARLGGLDEAVDSETAPVDDLEAFAEAMRLHAFGDCERAADLLERLEGAGRLTALLPSADFYWLLGVCRKACGDCGGAARALYRALELDPGHTPTLAALDTL